MESESVFREGDTATVDHGSAAPVPLDELNSHSLGGGTVELVGYQAQRPQMASISSFA